MSVRFRECANSPSPVAAVGHEIDLGEARDGDVPPVGPQGDVVLQERPRLGPPVRPVVAGRRYGARRRSICRGLRRSSCRPPGAGEPETAPGPREPEREQGFQADRPGVAGRPPDCRQHWITRVHTSAAAAAAPGPLRAGGGPVEEAQGRLPMVARHLAELVEDPLLLRSARLLVARVDRPSSTPISLGDSR